VIDAPTHCPACGDVPIAAFTRRDVSLVRSPGCGLEWQRPFPSEESLAALYRADYFERWGVGTSEERMRRVRRMKEATHRAFLARVLALRPAGGRLLDVGCAFGFLLGVAGELGFEAYGLDLNTDAVSVARREFGDRVHAGVLGPDAFPGLAFDVVTLIDVLEHVPDPRALLNAAAGVLRARGVLAAVLPNAASLARRLLGRRWPHYAPEHLYHWTPAALRRFLSENGWRVLALETGVRKTYTTEYLQSYSKALGGWLPPGLGLLGNRRLRVPTGEMLVIAERPAESSSGA